MCEIFPKLKTKTKVQRPFIVDFGYILYNVLVFPLMNLNMMPAGNLHCFLKSTNVLLFILFLKDSKVHAF